MQSAHFLVAVARAVAVAVATPPLKVMVENSVVEKIKYHHCCGKTMMKGKKVKILLNFSMKFMVSSEYIISTIIFKVQFFSRNGNAE